MSLDIFQNDATAAMAEASRRIAPDLPATFSDTFDNAVTTGIEWHNSVASQFAKEHALNDYIQYVRDKTGETLPNPGYLVGGESLDGFNEKQSKIADAHPDLNLQPLTPADIDTMTRRRMAQTRDANVAMNARERTWGGTFGGLTGGLTAGFTDPVILATLPLGGMGELGILGRGLEFGAIGAGTETAIAALTHASHEAASPGSTKGMVGDIAAAGAFGFALGGAFGALGRLLRAGERPLPTSIRDDINVGASEAQLNATNVFPTAAGEMAGRDAVTQAVTQAAKGEPITAGNGFDPAHVAAFAADIDKPAVGYVRFYHGGTDPDSGGPRWLTPQQDYARNFRSMGEPNEVHYVDIPQRALETDPALAGGWDEVNGYVRNFEAPEAIAKQLKLLPIKDTAALAAAGERSQRPITFGEMPDFERFETMPIAGEDTAAYWDRHLEGATADERAALGATDEAAPRALTSEALKPTEGASGRITARNLSPEAVAKLADEPATYDAVQRNLDRIRLENPNAEFSTQIRQPDGTYQLVTRRLEDVLDEIDGMETAGKELMACATGMQAAE